MMDIVVDIKVQNSDELSCGQHFYFFFDVVPGCGKASPRRLLSTKCQRGGDKFTVTDLQTHCTIAIALEPFCAVQSATTYNFSVLAKRDNGSSDYTGDIV